MTSQHYDKSRCSGSAYDEKFRKAFWLSKMIVWGLTLVLSLMVLNLIVSPRKIGHVPCVRMCAIMSMWIVSYSNLTYFI